MSKKLLFKVGDRVTHKIKGTGTVDALDEFCDQGMQYKVHYDSSAHNTCWVTLDKLAPPVPLKYTLIRGGYIQESETELVRVMFEDSISKDMPEEIIEHWKKGNLEYVC